MKVVLEIPKEFENHYNTERFQDSLKRINYDIRSIRYEGLSGTYEYELIEMLIDAFQKGETYDRSQSSNIGDKDS